MGFHFVTPINFKNKAKKLHVNNNGYDLLNFTHVANTALRVFVA